MRTLFLMRHAHAEHRSNVPDIERRLDIHGEREAEKMGHRLLETRIVPQLILSSPAIRAYATALIMAEVLTGTTKGVLIENSIYKNDEDELLDLIRRQEDSLEQLMLVGHNPSMTALAASLSTEMDGALPPAGLAVFYFSVNRWSDVNRSQGKLLLLETPSK